MANQKVLVVDDTSAHLLKLKDIVKGAGCNVVTATSGVEAIAKAKSELPALIFMDIVMDEIDGYGACREITKDDSTKHIPVVFVSTKNQRADKLWAEKQGARGLISKPYKDEEILEQIKLYL